MSKKKLKRNINKPNIFIPSNDTLIEVLYEHDENFQIWWFHFPKDGFLPIEDYEPIIFIYKHNELQYLITRRHWEYQTYYIENLYNPLEILFDGEFHPPFPRTKDGDILFNEKIKNCERLNNYEIKEISPTCISEKFRVGKGHPSSILKNWLWLKKIKDPRDKAEEILSNI